jgi:uncharacterized protein (TIGR02246 family)
MKYLFILLGVVCLSFMLLPACAPPAEEVAKPVTEEAPSTEADVAAIKSVDKKFLAAMNAGDASTMLNLCADDIVIMPPNETAVTGREATGSWTQSFVDNITVDETWSSEEVVVFGDWAFSRGTWAGTNTPKAGGEAIQDNGKYLWILKRQSDGSWKYARFIWNSDNPPPGEPTT